MIKTESILNPKIEVKDTNKYGLGVFAKEIIKKGEAIHTLKGEEITGAVGDKMVVDGLLNNDDPLQVDDDNYFILDNLSHAFNHSCEPNAALKDVSTLFALRDIKEGEEITYDYSTTVGPDNFTFTTMNNCLCGSTKCRKSLGNVLSIPEDILKFYKETGALQNYIVKALKNINKY
ncbi:MAG: SET domain-containing protein-lysine N-methyltransferase [Candidatus Paceibacterota bacterium]|jgi:SET domain-containing protein